MKALAAEERIGGRGPLRPPTRDRDPGVAQSARRAALTLNRPVARVTCADLGPASAVLESGVDSWIGLGCDVVVEVEDVGEVVAALDLP